MPSLNRVTIIGHLGKDPEQRAAGPVTFSVATSERWKDDSGTPQERTEWHRVVAFGKLGELCKQYLAKGRPVYVDGRLQTREWEKDGVKRYSTEIVARDVLFLGAKGQAAAAPSEDPLPSEPPPF